MTEIALLGGGGLAIEITDYMRTDGIDIVGYYSPSKESGLSGVLSWLGDENTAFEENLYYVLASGNIEIRQNMIAFLKNNNLKSYTFVSSRSHVSSFSKIGIGAFITPFVAITGNPVIGDYFFANAHSSVGHDTCIGSNVVLGPGARVCGWCNIGNDFSMGANASLLPRAKIGNNVEVAINTYPKKKVLSNTLVFSKPGEQLLKV